MKNYCGRYPGVAAAAFLLALMGPVAVLAAVPPTPPAAATASRPPVTRETIAAVLGRLYGHAEKVNPAVVIDRKTGQPITDFTTPNPDAVVRLGNYPWGVVHSGMLFAGEVNGDKRYTDFTARRLQLIADRLPYFRAQAQKYGRRGNSFSGILAPSSLDSCGAWGAAMVKARRAGVGPDLKEVIDRWAEFVRHKQFRLPDGTLARRSPHPESLWADDMYMSVPFLAQMGKLTGDAVYYDDAVRQVLQISRRLFDEPKGIYAHGWSSDDTKETPRFYWGRANGWCLMAMAELLDVLPEDHPGREAVLKQFRAQVKGLAPLQTPDGLWHQLLDKPDSFEETSCSAMFTFAMARAINRGWIDAKEYGPVVRAGWSGVAARVTPEGAVEGTCIGTNYKDTAEYYDSRPHVDNDHSYGPVLLAGAEMIRLLGKAK